MIPHNRGFLTTGRAFMLGASVLWCAAILLQLSLWPTFEWKRYQIREAVRGSILATLPPGELTTLSFTPEQFAGLTSMDDGREILLDGIVYDIVRMTEDHDGSIQVQAYRDDDETAELIDLDRLTGLLQGEDEDDQEQRVVTVGSWAPFHEWSTTISFRLSASARVFGLTCGMPIDRVIDVEPAPPRKTWIS